MRQVRLSAWLTGSRDLPEAMELDDGAEQAAHPERGSRGEEQQHCGSSTWAALLQHHQLAQSGSCRPQVPLQQGLLPCCSKRSMAAFPPPQEAVLSDSSSRGKAVRLRRHQQRGSRSSSQAAAAQRP